MNDNTGLQYRLLNQLINWLIAITLINGSLDIIFYRWVGLSLSIFAFAVFFVAKHHLQPNQERVQQVKNAILWFGSIVFIPLFWFLLGGSQSSIAYFVILVIVSTIILSDSKSRGTFVTASVSLALLSIAAEFLGLEPLEEEVFRFEREFFMALNLALVAGTIANLLAIYHVAYKKEVKRLHSILWIDHLTNGPNRRALMDDLNKLPAPKYLILIDMDNCKALNDQFGHVHGDEAIFFLGTTIKRLCPLGANFGRMGGDEFVIALYDENEAQCTTLAKELRKEFTSHMGLLYPGLNLDLTIAYGPVPGDAEITAVLSQLDQHIVQEKGTKKGVEPNDPHPVRRTTRFQY